jgi:hypothetical protein
MYAFGNAAGAPQQGGFNFGAEQQQQQGAPQGAFNFQGFGK